MAKKDHCEFCSAPVTTGSRRCPEHVHLLLPWEEVDRGWRRRGRQDRLELSRHVDRRPRALVEADGQLTVFAAWCDECNTTVHPDSGGHCRSCGVLIVDLVTLKVSELNIV